MEIARVAIIGAGPAGIAAAVQLKRCGITPLIFEKDEVGGLLRNANLVENYPGFPGGITGPELVRRIARQLADAGIDVISDSVQNLEFSSGLFLIDTLKGDYHAQYVIVASGTTPRRPTSLAISPGAASHVYFEVFQLIEENGKKIVIIGAGDAAFDYALNLSRRNEVTIINRGTAVKCNPALWNRAMTASRITYSPEVVVAQVSKVEDGDPMAQVYVSSENGMVYPADYVIFAIGRDAQLDFLSENVRLSQNELIVDGKLYFIGDVKNKLFRQTAIAVGDGVRAAMEISRCIGP